MARNRTKLCRAGARSGVVKRCRTFLRSASHTLTDCLCDVSFLFLINLSVNPFPGPPGLAPQPLTDQRTAP